MNTNKKREVKTIVKDGVGYPFYGHYKSIHNLDRNMEFRLDEESEMFYTVVDDTAGEMTGEIVNIEDFRSFREKYGLLIELAVVYEKNIYRDNREDVDKMIESDRRWMEKLN